MSVNCLTTVKILSTDYNTTEALKGLVKFNEKYPEDEFYVETNQKTQFKCTAIVSNIAQFEIDGDCSEFKINCICNWAPPSEMAKTISALYPKATVTIDYYEKDMNIGGIKEYRNGICVYDNEMSYTEFIIYSAPEEMQNMLVDFFNNEYLFSLKEMKKTSMFKNLDKVKKYKFANNFKAERLKKLKSNGS